MAVAVTKNKIAAVEKDIPARQAGKVVNASGLYVTPGLIDIHFHIGHGGAPLNWFTPEARAHIGPLGIPADLALQSGVTTLVDAGTAGAETFLQEKEEVIDHAKVRVLAFLNIVANGMNGGLEQSVDQMDPKLCAETIKKYPDIIVGVKTAHFWFRNAVPAAKQGFVPDSMSTDLHTGNYTVLSMNNVMSKFLAMGVPLEDVIRRSTVNPAKEIHRPELGTLSVGKDADIAVLEEQHGPFGYIDCGVARMDGNVKLVTRMTVRAGKILYDPSGLSMIEWKKARPQYFTTPGLGNSKPARADDFPRE